VAKRHTLPIEAENGGGGMDTQGDSGLISPENARTKANSEHPAVIYNYTSSAEDVLFPVILLLHEFGR